MMSRAAAALVVLVLMAGWGGPTARAAPVVSPVLANLLAFVPVASGGTSCHWPARVTIYNHTQWAMLWTAHVGGQTLNPFSQGCSLSSPAPPRPWVDFTHYSVAAIFTNYGQPRSLAVNRIVRDAHQDVVYYSVSSSPATPPASLNPFLMVGVQTLNYLVIFIEEPSVIRPSVIRR